MEGIGRDWIKWHKNPPFASHMGGVWERQIRSARAILASILKTHGKSLDDESLLTLMTEVEGILNSRPLTVEMINDPSSFQPLAPANILTMKSKVVMPPPGKLLRPDLYRRRWSRVQHIANEFWSRWRKEYLQSLQERQKWNTRRRNFVIGDIVLLKTMDVSRNKWPMAKVTATKSDQNGLVRSVYLKIGDRPETEKSKNIVERPVDQIVLLLENNVFDPHQGANSCFVINLVITRGAICNCTLIKCSLGQSAR